jgi:hypothetical protein
MAVLLNLVTLHPLYQHYKNDIGKQKSQHIGIQRIGLYKSDLDRIQTCNLLSRNQVHYSVMLRGQK